MTISLLRLHHSSQKVNFTICEKNTSSCSIFTNEVSLESWEGDKTRKNIGEVTKNVFLGVKLAQKLLLLLFQNKRSYQLILFTMTKLNMLSNKNKLVSLKNACFPPEKCTQNQKIFDMQPVWTGSTWIWIWIDANSFRSTCMQIRKSPKPINFEVFSQHWSFMSNQKKKKHEKKHKIFWNEEIGVFVVVPPKWNLLRFNTFTRLYHSKNRSKWSWHIHE